MNNLTKIKSKGKEADNQVLNLDKIGIICNTRHEYAEEVAERLKMLLESKGFSNISTQKLDGKKDKFTAATDLGIAFIVGGDGTFLSAARYFSRYGVPLFGISTGRLGFLSQLRPKQLEEGIDKILSGNFIIEDRLMLKFETDDKSESCSALNDVVIKGVDVSGTAQLFLYINGKQVCDYLADGLIIATPTGSTAYTLSAGGPVVMPELEAFVIVPICPHSLTTRPILVPAYETIEVKVKIDSDYICVTNDGQESYKIDSRKTIRIVKNDHTARLITLTDNDNVFYSVLREKLHWGIAPYE